MARQSRSQLSQSSHEGGGSSPKSSISHDELLAASIQSQMRNSALYLVYRLFEEEVDRLCGPRYAQDALASKPRRAGSDKGSVILGGQRVSVRKPRVKHDGKEVQLQTYQALQDIELINSKVMQAMLSGVSTNRYASILEPIEQGRKLSSSSVSRAFKMSSRRALDNLNSRDLSSDKFFALILDAIHFDGRAVICGLGITQEGQKMVLGLREGDSENGEVARDLLRSFVDRGFSHQGVLFVTDGGHALRKAIKALYGQKALVQRCAVHKERNVLSYLPKPYHGEFRRRWKLLHGTVSYAEALKISNKLSLWLARINQAAAQSFEEADQETLTVVKLGLPAPIRSTVVSTNLIESCFSTVRSTTKRVKNWRKGSDQISRWAAAALIEAEKGFRKVNGCKALPEIVQKLKKAQKR